MGSLSIKLIEKKTYPTVYTLGEGKLAHYITIPNIFDILQMCAYINLANSICRLSFTQLCSYSLNKLLQSCCFFFNPSVAA